VFGTVTAGQVIAILASCAIAAMATGVFLAVRAWRRRVTATGVSARPAVVRGGAVPAARRSEERENKENWRMPPLAMLAPAPMSRARRIGMSAMYVYLGAAIILVIVRVAEIAAGH